MPNLLTRRAMNAGALASTVSLAAPRAAHAAQTTLILSHHVPTAHLVHRTSQRFAALVSEATGGQVAIDIKPSGQLFNLRSGAEALRLGTVDLCWTDLGTLGNWRPEFGFTSLPFLFTGFDQVKKVLYGPVGERVRADVQKLLSIEVLSLGASGFRVFLGNKHIQTADDCKGIKLRVPEIPIYVEMARAIGANPTPIPTDGIYTALQTHIVDMIEIPPDYIVDTKMWEVGPHACRTNHIFTEVSLMASAARVATLPPEVQKALRDAAQQAVAVEMWAANLKNQEDAWTTLASHSDAVAEPDRQSFRVKTRPVIDNFVVKNTAAKAYVDGVAATV
jgi:tripartite ATP-independent transporter DctP family solute receptor